MFSLVTFARRPLTIGEISEAVTILRSPSGRLEEAHKPYLPKLLDLLPPLLEVGEDATDDVRTLLSKTCRLYHSTVFDYLRRKAKIICESEDNAEEPSPSGSDFRFAPSVSQTPAYATSHKSGIRSCCSGGKTSGLMRMANQSPRKPQNAHSSLTAQRTGTSMLT